MIKKWFRTTEDVIYFILISALFLSFAFGGDIMELGDSHQYLHLFVSREPLYPLFTRIFTLIFGYDGYGKMLILMQNLIAIVATYFAYYKIVELIKFPQRCNLLVGILLVVPHVITPLASKSHMILTNSAATEGISFSLYYIWFVYALDCLVSKKCKKKSRVLLWLFATVLSLIRGQFIVLLVVNFMIIVYKGISEKNVKKIMIAFLTVVVILGGKSLFTKAYNYINWSIYTNTVASKPMMLANIAYLNDKNAAEGIPDYKLRQVYLDILEGACAEQLTIEYSGKGIITKAKFHESGHEIINFNHIDPVVRAYIRENYGIDESTYQDLLVCEENVTDEIISYVLPNVIGNYMSNYIVIASLGFVRSIAIEKSVIPFLALILYVIVIAVLIYKVCKKEYTRAFYFMSLVLVLICGTVFGTSLVIECISRYMIYNLPLFYMAILALLGEMAVKGEKNEL